MILFCKIFFRNKCAAVHDNFVSGGKKKIHAYVSVDILDISPHFTSSL